MYSIYVLLPMYVFTAFPTLLCFFFWYYYYLSLTSLLFFSFFILIQWPKQLNAPLEAVDPEIANIIELEKARQWKVHLLILC